MRTAMPRKPSPTGSRIIRVRWDEYSGADEQSNPRGPESSVGISSPPWSATMCSITNAAKFERLKHSRLIVIALILTCLLLAVARPLRAQAGFGDDRVMLQGFYYESDR